MSDLPNERPFESVIVVVDDLRSGRTHFTADGYRYLAKHRNCQRLIPGDRGRADVELATGDQAIRLIRQNGFGLPTRLSLPDCDLWFFPTTDGRDSAQVLVDLRTERNPAEPPAGATP
jgi:hypothetical protein